MSFERTTSCGVISGTACQWPALPLTRASLRHRRAVGVPRPRHPLGRCLRCHPVRCLLLPAPAPSMTKPPHPEKPSTTTSSARARLTLIARLCLFLNILGSCRYSSRGQTAGHLLHSRRRLYRRLRPREALRRPRLAHQRLRGCDHQLPARPHGLCLPARAGR